MKCAIVDNDSQELIHLMAPHSIPTNVKFMQGSSSSYKLTECLTVQRAQINID